MPSEPRLNFSFSPPPGRIARRDVLLAGLPAFIVVAICLSFQLSKAFTIDDPIFLRTAEQILKAPLRPLAFDMCWESDGNVRRISTYILHAPLMGYVLIPAVRSPRPEVVGHLLQLILLGCGTLATASLALRAGLSVRQALLAATLTATCPVVIGMTSTVMPDILAMTLSVVAVERFVAWRQGGGWGAATAAVAAMALGPLARPHVALIIPVCVLLSMAEVSLQWVRTEWRQLAPGLILAAISCALYGGIVLLTSDPAAGIRVLRRSHLNLSKAIVDHTLSLGSYLCLTTPLVAGVLVFVVRRVYWLLAALACAALATGVTFIAGKPDWYLNAVSALAYLSVAWVIVELLKCRSGAALGIALWMLAPVVVVPYLQMAPKYLVPSVPAYALILAMLAGRALERARWMWAALPVAGLAMGLLIVAGDARAANMARFAIDKWVPPLEAQGKKVWFLGQWGFQWYAERRHAACFPAGSPALIPGDFVVIDRIGGHPFPLHLYPRSQLVDVESARSPGGLVLERSFDAGFFSDGFGRLPWTWAAAGTPRYELWKIQ